MTGLEDSAMDTLVFSFPFSVSLALRYSFDHESKHRRPRDRRAPYTTREALRDSGRDQQRRYFHPRDRPRLFRRLVSIDSRRRAVSADERLFFTDVAAGENDARRGRGRDDIDGGTVRAKNRTPA